MVFRTINANIEDILKNIPKLRFGIKEFKESFNNVSDSSFKFPDSKLIKGFTNELNELKNSGRATGEELSDLLNRASKFTENPALVDYFNNVATSADGARASVEGAYAAMLNGDTHGIKNVKNIIAAYNDLESGVGNLSEAQTAFAKGTAKSNQILAETMAKAKGGKITWGQYAGAVVKSKLATIGLQLVSAAASMAIGALISGAITLIQKVIHEMDDLKDKIDDLKSKYEDTKSKLEDINSKLDENKKKIEEINQNPLDITNKETLNELIKENEQLEKQKQLLEDIAEKEKRDLNKEVSDYLNKNSKYKTDDYWSGVGDNFKNLFNLEKDFKEIFNKNTTWGERIKLAAPYVPMLIPNNAVPGALSAILSKSAGAFIPDKQSILDETESFNDEFEEKLSRLEKIFDNHDGKIDASFSFKSYKNLADSLGKLNEQRLEEINNLELYRDTLDETSEEYERVTEILDKYYDSVKRYESLTSNGKLDIDKGFFLTQDIIENFIGGDGSIAYKEGKYAEADFIFQNYLKDNPVEDLTNETLEKFRNGLLELANGDKVFEDYFNNAVNNLKVTTPHLEYNIVPTVTTDTKELESGFAAAKEQIDDVLKNTNLFDKAKESIEKGESIDFSDVQAMIEIDNSLANKFVKTADGYTIAVDKLAAARNNYINSTEESLKADIQSAEEIKKVAKGNIDILQKQSDRLSMAANYDSNAAKKKSEIDGLIQEQQLAFDSCNNIIDQDNLLLKELQGNLSDTTDTLEDFSEVYETTASNVSLMKSAIEEQEKSGRLSGETIKKLIDAGYSNSLSYNAQTGETILLTDAVKDLTKAQIEEKKVELQKSIDEATESLRKSREEYERYKNAFNGNSGDAEKLSQLVKTIAECESMLPELNEQLMMWASLTFSLDGDGDSAEETAKDIVEKEKADLDHLLAMDVITEDEYYQQLLDLVNQYYKDQEDYLDEYRKYEEEIYKHLKQQKLDAINEEINRLKSVNEEKQAEIDLEEKRQALENARNQKNVRVYDSERGWTYETNRENVKSAQKDYDNALLDKQVSALEKVKEAIENGKNTAHSETSNVDIQTQVDSLTESTGYKAGDTISPDELDSMFKKYGFDVNSKEFQIQATDSINRMVGNPYQSITSQYDNPVSQVFNNSNNMTINVGKIVTDSLQDFIKQVTDIADSRFETNMNEFSKGFKLYKMNHS